MIGGGAKGPAGVYVVPSFAVSVTCRPGAQDGLGGHFT